MAAHLSTVLRATQGMYDRERSAYVTPDAATVKSYEERLRSGLPVPSTDRVRDYCPEHHYPFIPLGLAVWKRGMDAAVSSMNTAGLPPPEIRFLEVGCGPATKTLLARDCYQLDATGIEYDPRWMEVAPQLIGERAMRADATSFARYRDYNLIYFYQPLKEATPAAFAFELNLLQTTEPGTHIFAHCVLGSLLRGYEGRAPRGWKYLPTPPDEHQAMVLLRKDGPRGDDPWDGWWEILHFSSPDVRADFAQAYPQLGAALLAGDTPRSRL